MRYLAALLLASCAPPVQCPEPTSLPEAATVVITMGEWGRCGAVATGPTRLETVEHCLFDGATRGGFLLRGEWVMTRSWQLSGCREADRERICTLTTDRPVPAWTTWGTGEDCLGGVAVHHYQRDWSVSRADSDSYRLTLRAGHGASGGGFFCGDHLHSLISGAYGDGQIVTIR